MNNNDNNYAFYWICFSGKSRPPKRPLTDQRREPEGGGRQIQQTWTSLNGCFWWDAHAEMGPTSRLGSGPGGPRASASAGRSSENLRPSSDSCSQVGREGLKRWSCGPVEWRRGWAGALRSSEEALKRRRMAGNLKKTWRNRILGDGSVGNCPAAARSRINGGNQVDG